MRRLPPLFLTLLVLAAATGTANAQRAISRQSVRAPSGLVLNAHLSAMPGFSIGGRDFDTPSDLGTGPGVGAQIGYAIDPRFLIYAGADLGRLGAAAEDPTNHWSFTMLEVGGRMSFPSAKRKVTPAPRPPRGARSGVAVVAVMATLVGAIARGRDLRGRRPRRLRGLRLHARGHRVLGDDRCSWRTPRGVAPPLYSGNACRSP